tara:strand:+ start:557 stop:691 length:135 start_codon:yes stop_codon:yes gene_type:complete
MNEDIRNYLTERALADAIQEAINLEYGFIACGLSFSELMMGIKS